MPIGRWASLLAVAVLAPVGHAQPQSFAVEFDVSNNGSVNLGGEIAVDARLSGLTYISAADDTQVGMATENGRILVIRERQAGLWYDPGPFHGNLSDMVHDTEYASEDFAFDGQLTATAIPGSVANVMPHAEGGSFWVPLKGNDLALTTMPWQLRGFQPEFGNRHYYAADDFGTLGLPATASFAVPACVVIYGTDVTLQNATATRRIHTGWDVIAGSNPQDVNGATVHERVYVIACAHDAGLTLTGGPAWGMHIEALSGQVQGLISLTDAHGFDGTPAWEPGNASLLQAEGLFTVSATYVDGGQAWSVKGTGTFFGVDGQTVLGQKGVEWSTIASVTGGLGILGLLAWLARRLLLEVAWFTGYSKAKPLGNATRVQMLQLIESEPGITSSRLVEALAVKRATVMFHGRVLADHGHIEMRLENHQWHFTKTQPTSREGSTDLAKLACLAHPIRRAMHRYLVEAGQPLTAAQIRQRAAQEGRRLPFAFMAYHLPILERNGLIQSTRSGRIQTYVACSQPSQVFAARLATPSLTNAVNP